MEGRAGVVQGGIQKIRVKGKIFQQSRSGSPFGCGDVLLGWHLLPSHGCPCCPKGLSPHLPASSLQVPHEDWAAGRRWKRTRTSAEDSRERGQTLPFTSTHHTLSAGLAIVYPILLCQGKWLQWDEWWEKEIFWSQIRCCGVQPSRGGFGVQVSPSSLCTRVSLWVLHPFMGWALCISDLKGSCP